ncbi:MAG: hypothetical protein KQJ78_25070 [Deltaproteobacteria bacterium]|nr:hypothetical protein [Deltaproteobacteria bacterium]
MRAVRPHFLYLLNTLGLLASLAGGLLLHKFWVDLGLPQVPSGHPQAELVRPGGLSLFFTLLFPCTEFLGTLVLTLLTVLLPDWREEPRRRLVLSGLYWDAATYLVLPVAVVAVSLWTWLGNGFFALGLLFFVLLPAKAAVIGRLVWRGFLAPSAENPEPAFGARQKFAVFLLAALVFSLAAAWYTQAASSASDEVGYLLLADSLTQGEGLDVGKAVERRDYLAFYWGRWSEHLAMSSETMGTMIYPYLIAPFYALGGRLGVLVFQGWLAALLLVQVLAWLRSRQVARGPAAAAAALTVTAAPVLLLSQQAYPDLAGALIFVVGLRALTWQERRIWAGLVAVLFLAGFLALLKFRLAPLAVGLGLTAVYQTLEAGWSRRTAWLAVGGLILLAVAGAWLIPESWLPGFVANQKATVSEIWKMRGDWWYPFWVFFLGLSLDQQFGLFLAAPVFILALAGVPAALRKDPRGTAHFLVPAGLFLLVLCLLRWPKWYGGFAVPARFLVAFLPATALGLAPVLAALGRPWWRLAAWLPGFLGLFYVWLLNLLPHLRFSRAVGVNHVVAKLQEQLGLDLHHLLPSTFSDSPALLPWLGAVAGLLGFYGALAWRPPTRPAREAGTRTLPLEILCLGLLLALGASLVLGGGALFPPRFLEAEQMESNQAPLWVDHAYQVSLRGRSLAPESQVRGRLYFPGGEARLLIRADSNASGLIEVLVDGHSLVQVPFSKDDRRATAAMGPVEAGNHTLTIIWHSLPKPPGQEAFLLLDRVELLDRGPTLSR